MASDLFYLQQKSLMELHQLRYFCAIVRAGNFTRAAEQLGIAQPSLSQQIRALEKSVGAPLFERLGRSVRLTAHGEALNRPALDILQRVAEAEASLASLQQGVRGRLRVGVIPTIMPYLVAPRVRSFLETFPDVDLQFTEDTTSQLIEQLKAGDLDIVVAGLPIRNPDIVCSELFRERLFLAVALRHPLAQQPNVHLHHIQNERFLLLKEGHCLRDDVLMACNRAKAELHSVFETNQLESIFQLVRANFGLTLIPAMAKEHATGCTLIPLSLDVFRRVGYLRVRRHPVSLSMRAFTDWLRKLKETNDFEGMKEVSVIHQSANSTPAIMNATKTTRASIQGERKN
jgi:LysR family hydrogen peroxide-inducible transcriptional activator